MNILNPEVFKILSTRAKRLVDEDKEWEAPEGLNPVALFDSLREKKEKQSQ